MNGRTTVIALGIVALSFLVAILRSAIHPDDGYWRE